MLLIYVELWLVILKWNNYPLSIELAKAKIFVFLSIVYNEHPLTEPKIISGYTAIVRNSIMPKAHCIIYIYIIKVYYMKLFVNLRNCEIKLSL